MEERLVQKYEGQTPDIESIQDCVEEDSYGKWLCFVARKYILYRSERSLARERNSNLMRIYDELTNKAANLSDIKRDNANIDGDTAMGVMLKYGSEEQRTIMRNLFYSSSG